MSVRILERTTYRSPLALRFLDAATREQVGRGLVVKAWPVGQRALSRPSQASLASSLHGFTNLPGLAGYQDGRRPATDWCPNANAPGNFVVRAEDRLGRFQPVVLLLCVPREAVVEVPLFSMPSRPAPAGLGVIRGEVRDQATGGPASWATVEAVTPGGTSTLTQCDERGMFLALLPYADALPPEGLAWDVTIRFNYQPSTQAAVDGAGPGDPPEARSLLAQGPATPAQITRQLRYGHPLVVATEVQPA